MTEPCLRHSKTEADIDNLKNAHNTLDTKLVAIVQWQHELRERVATEELSIEMVIERIEKLEPLTETLVRLSMSVESLVEKLDAHISITSELNKRMLTLEQRDAHDAVEFNTFVKNTSVAAGIGVVLGLLIPRVVQVLGG